MLHKASLNIYNQARPFKVGITERGDAALDFSWIDKMLSVDMAIIISKRLSDELIDKLVWTKDAVIFHMTVTGYGGTVLEPNVPSPKWALKQFYKLIDQGFNIEAGFPVEQIVLRIDPIIPTPKGLQRVKEVLDLFSCTGISRVRYSFIDMYTHVIERFTNAGLRNPYGTDEFAPSKAHIDQAMKLIDSYRHIYQFESCSEYTKDQVGCISQLDVDILKIPGTLQGSSKQRKSCLCPGNKIELLGKRSQCEHRCLYCYWHN